MTKSIIVKNLPININISKSDNDFICLTDIAKFKNSDDPRFVVQRWMSSRSIVEFLGAWEQMHNLNFNRVEFDAVKNNSGGNSFSLSPDKWAKSTGAIGIHSKSGRYGGGTFAHKDIAFEFASWLSPEFKLYLIKEFQRLKEVENKSINLEWNLQRTLSKINYQIHTDAIKEKLIPPAISKKQTSIIYASEADLLNVALFGKTAAEFKIENPKFDGNLRDNASLEQLVILTNLESINSVLIRQNLSQGERLKRLNETAIVQMKSLLGSNQLKNKLIN
jgi:hypothetical protein